MNNNNRLKGMYALLVAVATMIGITVYGSCSADEDFWGFDEEYASTENTRAETKDMSEYLTLSTYNPKCWKNKELMLVGKAIERIGIIFNESKHRYEFGATSCRDVNISDSLYHVITSMFEHTNKAMATCGARNNNRQKMRSGEVYGYGFDCVPSAISNMGENAPSYAEAIAKCTELFPMWATQGVPGKRVKEFIEVYTPVREFNNLTFCQGLTGSLPNIVTCYSHYGGSGRHAVNAYAYVNTGYSKIIFYEDVSSASSGNGSIILQQLYRIFPFDSMFN